MATRAASAAPIQRALGESGITNPLSLANRTSPLFNDLWNAGYSLHRGREPGTTVRLALAG
jgi:hypothetical protein